MQSGQQKLKIALIGATGAIGKEIVRASSSYPNVELTVVVRNLLPEWSTYNQLKTIQLESFDRLNENENQFEGYDGFICTLGTRVKYGDDNFIKVDYTYPLEFAKIAKNVNSHYYGLLTSVGSDSTSMFLYIRTKGKIENAVKDLKIPNVSILKPGFLEDRDGDFRWIEWFMKKIRIGTRVQSKYLGEMMLKHAVDNILEKKAGVFVLENQDILDYMKK